MTILDARQRSTSALHAPIEAADITRFLSEHLGRQLLAFIVASDVTTIDRWARGNNKPRLQHEQRLRNTYSVFQEIARVEAPATVRAWFMGMNPQLDDHSPAEALADDRAREVLAAARAFVQGG
ncbi:hypothetical protein GCM10009640_06150 [Agrococcus citreus]|uniref:XRE family transcriptional regulator n=2 Tax=Agrococcus citreus TaxID=84643 RepID=A0ABN1YQY6_9MICO